MRVDDNDQKAIMVIIGSQDEHWAIAGLDRHRRRPLEPRGHCTHVLECMSGYATRLRLVLDMRHSHTIDPLVVGAYDIALGYELAEELAFVEIAVVSFVEIESLAVAQLAMKCFAEHMLPLVLGDGSSMALATLGYLLKPMSSCLGCFG
jgi:hypothetical protein